LAVSDILRIFASDIIQQTKEQNDINPFNTK